MAEKIEFTETVEENVNMLVENGRKVVLAGLGAVTLATGGAVQHVQQPG